MKLAVAPAKLAIEGGVPVRRAPFPPWPVFSQDEIEATDRVLASGRVNYWMGEEGRAFEREFAEQMGVKHAVALANGTAALELALHAIGVGAGDEVIVPRRSFIASASCVLRVGARPVFADVDRDSGNITASSTARLISSRARAVLVVHLAGWPCPMDEILRLARSRNLQVVEDCAQAQGATYNGAPVGSFGDVATFSFCQDKIMTTGGEGGMLVTNNEDLFKLAWSMKDHGKDYESAQVAESGSGFRWLHDRAGTNWRITEMQSAMGRRMLPKIGERIRKRQQNAEILQQALSRIGGLRLPRVPENLGHAYYRFYAYVEPHSLASGWERDRTLAAVAAEGIPCFSGSCSEIYLEKAFPAEMRPRERHPIARELGATSLAFLVHPTLGEQEMLDTAAAVEKVMAVARR